MNRRTLVTAAALALLPVLAGAPTAASVEVQSVSVQGGKIVLEVVDRPDSSAQVEVQINGRTHRVPVSGLRPNQRRTVSTSIDVPCGTPARVEARVGSSSKTETLNVSCAGSSGGNSSSSGSSGTFSSGRGGSSGSSGPGGSSRSAGSQVEIGGLAVNPRSGQLQAQVTLRSYPPGRRPIEVLFETGGVSEKVRAFGLALNNPKTVSTRQPFPCNATQQVTASVVSPSEWAGVSTSSTLSRQCSRTQGTPNLVPLNLERTELGESTAIPQTSIQVRVEVANDSEFDMPDNEQGGNWWYVRVSGLNRPQQVRRALKGGEKYSFTARVTQPCWSQQRDRFGQVTVTVDDRRNIRESNENDNQKTFTIERKRCRDAG